LEGVVEPEVMLPYLQYQGLAIYNPGNLIVRVAGDMTMIANRLRREIQMVDGTLPVPIETMEQVISRGLEGRRQRALLITTFASLALSLSILGVYAVVSFAVAGRTQEIGIRLALGARPGSAVRMMMQEGVALAAAGCAAGLLLAAVFARRLEGFLYGLAPQDPTSFLTAALTTLLVALIASYLPARRASKIDPAAALRYE
jgi:ABC-type antimicrobial peptide transport system permease subunit